MAWVYLFLAGLFEIGWPVGLYMAQQSETRTIGIVAAVAFMTVSGLLCGLPRNISLLAPPTLYGPALALPELFLSECSFTGIRPV